MADPRSNPKLNAIFAGFNNALGQKNDPDAPMPDPNEPVGTCPTCQRPLELNQDAVQKMQEGSGFKSE